MYERDIERGISNLTPIGFPSDITRQNAVNRVSLAIARSDEKGVEEIVNFAKYTENNHPSAGWAARLKQKKDSDKE